MHLQYQQHQLILGACEDHEGCDAKQDNPAVKDSAPDNALLRGDLRLHVPLPGGHPPCDRRAPLKDVAAPAPCLLNGLSANQVHPVEPIGRD